MTADGVVPAQDPQLPDEEPAPVGDIPVSEQTVLESKVGVETDQVEDAHTKATEPAQGVEAVKEPVSVECTGDNIESQSHHGQKYLSVLRYPYHLSAQNKTKFPHQTGGLPHSPS